MAAPRLFEFLAEAREHLTDVCDQLLRLERATGDDARDRVEQMLRAVHSIKGGAGFFGLRNVEQLAHLMESVLEAAVARPAKRAGPMIDVLLATSDRLAALFDDIDNSNQADISNVVARLDELQATFLPGELPETAPDSRVESHVSGSSVRMPAAATPTHEFEISIDLSHCQAYGLSPREVIERVMQLSQIVAGTLDLPHIDLAVAPPQHPIVWRGTITSVLDVATFQERLAIPVPDQGAAPSVPIESSASAAPSAAPAAAGSATIRIPVELVDRLMNLAGELVLVRNQSRRFTDQDQPLPGQVIQRLDSVTSEFQETVLQTRMQPVGNLFNKFPRLVRDLSRQLGKQLELQIDGAEVELDKTILDALSDPLTHLVRNACDHGLESSEERERAGKPATGRLRLAASHFGDQIWITIEDDGRGIDRERVREKALEQGLRTAEELARLDDRELLALILLPGFSTAAQVTDVSGRGVGMDVVANEIKKLGGSLQISSVTGQGTNFTIRLPFTLAITQALIVRTGEEVYALPLPTVEGVARISRADLERMLSQSEPSYEYGEQTYRFRHLGMYLGGQSAKLPEDDSFVPVILVRAGDHSAALLTDEMIASQEIVVKSLGPQLSSIRGISGATILGDGRIVLILDINALVRKGAPVVELKKAAPTPTDQRPLALVVDDSITVRRVMERFLQRNGMRVVTAKDGLDAISVLSDNKPDIILLDIEMPRMDGYEFAKHVRNDERISDVPIIMITSRVGDKHRARAIEIGVNDYLGKPYQDSRLLDSIQRLLEERGISLG